tara:strand:+ start:43100 stop:44407 length:1308 start_codon:yes stop_codon:yes gene_type:complete
MNSEINLSKLFFGYGIAIFPLFLLTGPLIPEIIMLCVILYSFFFIIKEKKIQFYKNRYFIFFGIFYLSIFFSTILNFYNFNNSINGLLYFRIPLFAFSIWFILNKFLTFDKKIVIFYSIFFLIIIFDSLIQYFYGKNLVGYEMLYDRVSSFFGKELIMGGFILRTLPIFLIYLVMNDILIKKNNNLFFIILISFLCFIVYLSGERTSFALLILFFFTLFFILKYLRKTIIFVVISFICFATILPNLKVSENPNPAKRMFEKSYNQILGVGEERYEKNKKKLFSKIYIFSHDHHGHYLLSYKIFKDHMIFGTGVKGFRYLCRNKIYILENDDGCSTHPHNTYVQILTSNGLVGFSILIFALFFIIREIFVCRKRINSSKEINKYQISKAIALAAIFINMWPLAPTGNFFNNWLSIFYFYPIGFYLFFNFVNEKKIS